MVAGAPQRAVAVLAVSPLFSPSASPSLPQEKTTKAGACGLTPLALLGVTSTTVGGFVLRSRVSTWMPVCAEAG